MYIGLDLGTSGLKGVVIDADQHVLAVAHADLTVSRPAEGWSEQRPADWVQALTRVMDQLAATMDLSAVRGIGLSGQMHGAVCLDAQGEVLRPCILWNDTRAHAEAAELDADSLFRAMTGNIVFPGFTAPKLLWMARHEPTLFNKIAKVLLPKDYLRFVMTGEYASDMSDAAGTAWFDTAARDWDDRLLSRTGLNRGQMPRLVEGSEVSGRILPRWASQWGLRHDVIVAGGAGDNAASAIGLGIVQAGKAFISLGTSGVLFAATDSYRPAPQTAVHSFCHAVPGMWHQMGVILSAADAVNWWADIQGQSAPEMLSCLGPLRAPGKALFLPYLGGERTPHNDAHIRGAFLGLEHAADPAALARAVIEGVTHAFRDNLQALEMSGTAISEVYAVGGGAQARYWVEALATALDLPIHLPQAGELGAAFGAARLGLMAAEAAGREILHPPPIAETIMPQPHLTAKFSQAYQRYQTAYHALKAL